MAYDVVESTTENIGSLHQERIVLDVASLSDAGHEAVAAGDEANVISRVDHAYVAGQEDPTYKFAYDHINDQLHAVAVADGTDVTASTDVGEVELIVVGN